MNLLFGHDQVVAEWATKMFGYPIKYLNAAIGILSGSGVLIGAGVFQCFNGTNVEFSYIGRGSVTASVVRGLMKYAFDHLKVCRVTAKTPRKNKVVVRSLSKFGFKMEGVMKHYYGPKKRLDAIVFGLMERDARKIIGERK